MPAEQGFHKRILADQAAPRRVDDAGPRGQPCDLAFTDDVACPWIQWQTKEEVLTPFEERLQVIFAARPLQTQAFHQVWVPVPHQTGKTHSERLEPHRQCLPDSAETQNTRCASAEAAPYRPSPG